MVEHFKMRSYRLFQCCTLYQCPRNCWQRIDRFDLCHRLSSKSSLYPCQVYLALAIFQFRSPFLLTTRNPSNTNATFFVHHSKYSIEIYKLNEKIKKMQLTLAGFPYAVHTNVSSSLISRLVIVQSGLTVCIKCE